jgi:hypothetical protein
MQVFMSHMLLGLRSIPGWVAELRALRDKLQNNAADVTDDAWGSFKLCRVKRLIVV